MTKPTSRANLVTAIREAAAIIEEGLPVEQDAQEAWQQETRALQAAALPVILRELLDYKVG